MAIRTVEGFDENEALRLAASLERGSEHPLAAAILESAKEKGLETAPVSDFDAPSGKGVSGKVESRTILLGNAELLREGGVDLGALEEQADELRKTGATTVFIAVDGKSVGFVAVADPVKETTPEAVRRLKAEGIRVVMLTGDNRTTAKAVAERVGVDEVEAGVLPADKSRIVS